MEARYSENELLDRYNMLDRDLRRKGINIDDVKEAVSHLKIEVPSWAFGAFGGGRFSGYTPPGAARDIFEKLDDAAVVNKLTGATPSVAIHLGWDDPYKSPFDKIEASSFKEVHDYADRHGLKIGSVSPTYFLEGTEFGSLTSNDPNVRERMIKHTLTAAEVARRFGNGLLTLWLPDGSLYPGQVDMIRRFRNLKSSLRKIYDITPKDVILLIEYKLFEPGTYHTVIPDFSAALQLTYWLGNRAGVLVDLGHHAHGVNVEYIVARIIDSGVHAAIHFNSRYAADDDHAVEPNMQVFRIFVELVKENVVGRWRYILDQCSPLENRIEAVIHSVDSLMISYAKALTVDYEKLNEYQLKNEIISANRTLLDAFLTDVRPIVYMARLERNLPLDPVAAYRELKYQEKIERERR